MYKNTIFQNININERFMLINRPVYDFIII